MTAGKIKQKRWGCNMRKDGFENKTFNRNNENRLKQRVAITSFFFQIDEQGQ